MRARFIATSVAVVVGFVATSVAPAEVSARQGLVVVPKKITLHFPQPGMYAGRVSIRSESKVKVKRNATRKKSKAGRRDRRAAIRSARMYCKMHLRDMPARVLHLSKPPFLIGTAKPRKTGFYSVSGPAPPTGDPVRAHQWSLSKKIKTDLYSWRVRCMGAGITKPYPY